MPLFNEKKKKDPIRQQHFLPRPAVRKWNKSITFFQSKKEEKGFHALSHLSLREKRKKERSQPNASNTVCSLRTRGKEKKKWNRHVHRPHKGRRTCVKPNIPQSTDALSRKKRGEEKTMWGTVGKVSSEEEKKGETAFADRLTSGEKKRRGAYFRRPHRHLHMLIGKRGGCD